MFTALILALLAGVIWGAGAAVFVFVVVLMVK